MDIFSPQIDFSALPHLGFIDVNQLWQDIAVKPIQCSSSLLSMYRQRHDEWTEKIRVIGLDGGLLVDYRVVPGLDRLVSYIHSQTGWARPEVYVVSDIGRKGVDSWSAVSVVSRKRPVILLGVDLVNTLDEVELAFVIAHETGHLLNYTGANQDGVTLSFLIKEFVETGRENELEQIIPEYRWQDIYRKIMSNCRHVETRCDRLGLLICGNYEKSASALLTATLKHPSIAKSVNIEQYLTVQTPLLETSPEASPINVNIGHPYLPYRIKYLKDFITTGQMVFYLRQFKR